MTGATPANMLEGKIENIAAHKLEINRFFSKWIKVILRTVFLLGIGFVILYPILFMLSSAFKSIADVSDQTVIWIPKHFSLYPLKLAMMSLDFWTALATTLKICIPSVIFQLVSTILTAYGFARFKFFGKNALFALLVFTIIVPIQTIIIPLYGNFAVAGVLGTCIPFYSMAMLGEGIRSGLYIFIMRQFFRNMPKELEEAAMIDGCGIFKTFLKVMLPNVIPAITTVTVFSVVWYWNDFYQSIMFMQSSSFPLSVQLTKLNDLLGISGQNIPNLSTIDLWLLRDGVLACGCLLTITPLVIMYLFLQRFFTESIERTGIVG